VGLDRIHVTVESLPFLLKGGEDESDLGIGRVVAGGLLEEALEVGGGGVLDEIGFEAFKGAGGFQDVGEEGDGFLVAGAGAVEARVGRSVVGGHDQEGVGHTLLELEADGEGIVEGDEIAHGGGDVAGVGAVVDAAAFDLEDEVPGGLELPEGGAGHVGEGGDGFSELVTCLVIDGEGEMSGGERAEAGLAAGCSGELAGGLEDRVAGPGELGVEISFVLAPGGLEVFPAAAEEDIDLPFEVLEGDVLGGAAVVGVGGESGGGGVGDFGCGDQPALPAGFGGQGAEGTEVRAVRELIQDAVDDTGTCAPTG